jgi:hypothetical protein
MRTKIARVLAAGVFFIMVAAPSTIAQADGDHSLKVQMGPLRVTCPHPAPLFKVPAYIKNLAELLEKMGIKEAECLSCFRDKAEQEQACIQSCGNPKGCGPPNNCAPPGSSQHQKIMVATCDIGKNAKLSCEILRKFCAEKYNGKCGIGIYPSGRAHLGVIIPGSDLPATAWSGCSNLHGARTRAQGQMARWQRIRGRHRRR